MTEQDVFDMAREVCGKWPRYMTNRNLQDFAKLVADKARQEMREEIIYTWVPPHFVDMAIESCAERAWLALVKHKQPWNVRQDVTEAIRARGEA